MKQSLRAACWLFFGLTMYDIFTEAISPWAHLPDLGNILFTVVFVLFAVLHCMLAEGGRRTAVFFAVSAVVTFIMEELGVRTGLVFGVYHYSDMLGPKLGHVPVLVPLAWFMMIYPSWCVARAAAWGMDSRTVPGFSMLAVVAAVVMTGWDMVMDPGMAAAQNWVWERGGAYFGVPRRNYIGWLVTTFLVYWIVGWLWRAQESQLPCARSFLALPVILYAFFALRYVAVGHVPALQPIALFSMGTPALLALAQMSLNRRRFEAA